MRIVTVASGETTTGAKTTINIVGSNRETFSFHLYGTGTFSVDVEGSFDGTNWNDLATAKTASEIFSVLAMPYLRLQCNTMTGANVSAKVGV